MTKLRCNNYCSPALVPQGATVSLNVWLTVQFGPSVGAGSWKKHPLRSRLRSPTSLRLTPKRLWWILEVSPAAHKGHLLRDSCETGWLQSQHLWPRAHLLLLDVQDGVVDGHKDMLRVHVAHQTAGREDLQDALCKDRKAPGAFQSVPHWVGVHNKEGNDPASWTGASPLQFAKYTRTPTFWHSVQIWKKEQKNQWIERLKQKPERRSLPACFGLTCVKSLAPATSTNITLLQSIRTAWISDSPVSGRKVLYLCVFFFK